MRINRDPGLAITEPQLIDAARHGTVKQFCIHQTDDGYYCTLSLSWRPGQILHLATRRAKTQAKLFKDIRRLVDHIRSKFPAVTDIKLHLLDV